MAPLNEVQITFFKEQGYLILKDFIEPEIVASWRQQLWDHLGASADDPDNWPDQYVVDGYTIEPPEQALGRLPQMQAVVEQLGGGKFTGGGSQVLAIWPNPEAAWKPADNGHIDGYGPNGWSGGFMLGATTYIEDVQPQGGAFSYWPQSHLPTHEFFLKDPSKIDGSFRAGPEWEERQWRIFSDATPYGSKEFVARAGSVILWHCFMCHTGSTNVRSTPRFGMFARWHHSDSATMRYDIAPDLWKYWGI